MSVCVCMCVCVSDIVQVTDKPPIFRSVGFEVLPLISVTYLHVGGYISSSNSLHIVDRELQENAIHVKLEFE